MFTDYWSLITNNWSLLTDNWSLNTGYWSLFDWFSVIKRSYPGPMADWSTAGQRPEPENKLTATNLEH